MKKSRVASGMVVSPGEQYPGPGLSVGKRTHLSYNEPDVGLLKVSQAVEERCRRMPFRVHGQRECDKVGCGPLTEAVLRFLLVLVVFRDIETRSCVTQPVGADSGCSHSIPE